MGAIERTRVARELLRDGLRKLLEAELGLVVVGEARDGAETVELARKVQPDILLLDLAMPRLSGLDVLRELAAASVPVRTIVLTANIERNEIVKALELGAWGVVLKESATQLLFKSIRSVKAGQYWIGRESLSSLVEAFRQALPAARKPARAKTFGLTPRERATTTHLAPRC